MPVPGVHSPLVLPLPFDVNIIRRRDEQQPEYRRVR